MKPLLCKAPNALARVVLPHCLGPKIAIAGAQPAFKVNLAISSLFIIIQIKSLTMKNQNTIFILLGIYIFNQVNQKYNFRFTWLK